MRYEELTDRGRIYWAIRAKLPDLRQAMNQAVEGFGDKDIEFAAFEAIARELADAVINQNSSDVAKARAED